MNKIIVLAFILFSIPSIAQVATGADTMFIDNNDCEILEINFAFNKYNRKCDEYNRFSRCYKAEIVSYSDKIMYGDSILIYIRCPEVLNSLPIKDSYTVKVCFDLVLLQGYPTKSDLPYKKSSLIRGVIVEIY